MSQFDYKADGELTASYLYDLINNYLDKILSANDTGEIKECECKINPKSSRLMQRWQYFCNNIKMTLYNRNNADYYKQLTVRYVEIVKERLQIYVQTNVLEAKQYFDLQQTLKAINFGAILPELEENRAKVLRRSSRKMLKVLNDVDFLKHANIDYILFNTPVDDIKPFLSDKVAIHKLNVNDLKTLIRRYADNRYQELTTLNFEEQDLQFQAQERDFYDEQITDQNGIGEEVELLIRQNMKAKLNMVNNSDIDDTDKIDKLLKYLKLHNLEALMQKLIKLKTNQAHAKEVIDKCKEVINDSIIDNKGTIFLLMDNLYYKLSKKCDKLQQHIKVKLQTTDKSKIFTLLEQFENNSIKKVDNLPLDELNLYSDEDETEIRVSEDVDDEAEDEVVIDE